MALAGALEIEIATGVARLQQDMAQVRGIVGGTMSEVSRVVGVAKGALAGLGVGFGVGAFTALIKGAIDAADHLNKMSQKVGVSVEDLSRLKYAADLSGVSAEALGKGLKGLAGNLVEATDKTSKQAAIFRALGVDISGGPMKVLPQLAESFSRLEDGEVKTALATKLFGKAGLDLIPLLNQGKDGLQKLSVEAERLGLVMRADTAKAAEQFNDNMRAIKANTEGVANDLLHKLAPSLVSITEAMKEAAIHGGTLKAVWVGLGGALAELLGMGDASFAKTRIRDIEKDIIRLTEETIPMLTKEAAIAQARGAPSKGWEVALQSAKTEVKALQTAIHALVTDERNPLGMFADQVDRLLNQGKRLPGKPSDALKSALAGDATGAAEAESAYKGLLKTLQEKLLVDKELTEVNKLDIALRAMTEKQLAQITPARRAELTALAAQVDLQKQNKDALEAWIKAELEWLDVMREVDALMDAADKKRTDAILGTEKLIEQIKFETTLIGKSNEERELAIALRNLELAGITKETQGYEGLVERLKEVIATQGAAKATNEAFLQSQRDQVSVWTELGDRAGRFFNDVLVDGKSAFRSLKELVKDLLRELVALFAKRWVLQIGASLLGGGAGAALAGQAGQLGAGSIAGSLLSGGALGGGVLGEFATGVSSGLIPGMGLAGEIGAFLGPIGVAIVGLTAAIALFSKPRGGPKDEGQGSASFDAQGRFTGSGGRPFNIIGTGADSQAEQFARTMGTSFFQMLQSLGGSSGGFTFGTGIVRDPKGTALTFMDTMVRDAAGNVIFNEHNANVGRSDEELQAELALQSKRALLAALQASDLPPAIASILNSVVATAASSEEIDAALKSASELQAMWAAFQNTFSTDAEKVAEAQKLVNAVFADMGQEVPKDVESFKKLAQSLYDAGDVENLQKLLSVAGAFKFVADAGQAAADALLGEWENVQGEIDRLTGRNQGVLAQADAAAQFVANNPWAGGKSPQQLVADLLTITKEDFANYSAENRKLILAILANADSVDENTAAVTAMTQAIVFPEREAASLQAGFQNKYGGLISAQPDMGSQLSLGITLMQEQIDKWKVSMAGLSEYSAEYQTYAKAIADFQDKINLSREDLAQLTIWTAQYGKTKAEELLNLKHWYDQQKALVGDSQEALVALEQTYADKRKAILEGSIDSLDGFRDWWRGLFQNEQISPLTLQQRFDLAKKDYDTALAAGDAGKIQSTAQLVLEIGRQLFGSNPAFTQLFAQITSQTGAFAGISPGEVNSRLYGALPSSGTLASTTDIGMLARTFRDEIRDLVTATIESAARTEEAVRESGDKVAGSVQNRVGALT